MDTFHDIMKTLQKQNEIRQSALGLASIQNLAAAVAKQKQLYDFAGISGLTEIAKAYSKQIKPFSVTKNLIDESVLAKLSAIQKATETSPLANLSSTLAELARKNQIASNNLSAFATSQIYSSNNLTQIAKALSQTHLSKFNSIDVAIKGLSTAFLKDISYSHNWEDIKVAENANEAVKTVTDELLDSNKPITVNDLDNLKQSIVSELFGLLKKTKTEKGRQFLFDLITVIAFLLTLYGTYVQNTDKSNKEVIQETKKEIEKINKEFSDKIEYEIRKLNRTRTSRVKTSLFFSGHKGSKIIGKVKTGQQVTVIEVLHKYLLVSYLDKETNESKSGCLVLK
ncbi:hypothetical protein LX80_02867 [Hydrotalea sandarakina]|uniref:Uncharacterized protein n=2 Tax=Hydrotalea sandarakina TaxID=1004304 RepID=A0A2W7REQ3_9BACT|nr:hypothetical protein LX80_02867 [Hydrotalea sandarakina]